MHPAQRNAHRLLIAVIGAGSASARGLLLAREVGELLARRGATVLCGGLGGVMEAASRGASEAGGCVIGLLPGADPEQGNPYLTYALPTNLGHARNVLIAQAARGLIAVEGEYGTLSEIAVALKLGRPVITLASRWELPGTEPAESPEAAVTRVLRRVGEER